MTSNRGWELWEAPHGKRHLVLSGKALCVRWWPNWNWVRVPSGFVTCRRCHRCWRASIRGYVTADGFLTDGKESGNGQ